MVSQFGRKPTNWSKSFWKKSKNPNYINLISSKELIIDFLKNKTKLIMVGGWASCYYGYSKKIKDYDLLISVEEKNIELVCSIIVKNYLLNVDVFKSNVSNFLKLKTLDKPVDIIKRINGWGEIPQIPKMHKTKTPYSLKHLTYNNLIENSKDSILFDFPVKVMAEEDYKISQYHRVS
jgi:hypothetical protein